MRCAGGGEGGGDGVRRKLFNRASAVSLLLCLATVALWLGSYRHIDGFSFWTSRGLFELAWRDGRFALDNEPQRDLDRDLARRIEHHLAALEEQAQRLNAEVAQALERARRPGNEQYRRLVRERPWSAKESEVLNQSHAANQRVTATILLATQLERPPAFTRTVSCGLVVAVTGALPAIWIVETMLIARRRGRRRKAGDCPACGYSLTGNTSGVCPECGTPVPKELAGKSPRPA